MRITDGLHFGFSRKLPLILQAESAESGLACLAMVLGYHKDYPDLPALRHRFPVSLKGMSAAQLIEIAGQLKFDAHAVELKVEDLGRLLLPSILQWGHNHYVVLKKVMGDAVVIHDPANGECKFTLTQAARLFSEKAIELKPVAEFVDRTLVESFGEARLEKKRRFSWKTLLGTTHGLKRSLLQVCALALAMEILVLILPLLYQLLYDQVIVTSDTNLLVIIVLGMLFLELSRITFNVLRAWSVMIMRTMLDVQWISNVFSHLLRLPIPWFDRRHMGDIISRFESTQAIQGMVTTRSIEVGLDGFMSIGGLVMMFIYNATLTWIVIGSLVLYFLLRLFWNPYERSAAEASAVFGAQEQSLFLESLRSIRTIRLFNAAKDRKSKWLNRLIAERNARLKRERISIMVVSSNWSLFGIQNIVIVTLGVLAVMHNHWSIGMFLAFLCYRDQFVTRSIGVVDKIMEFKVLGVQVERLSEIVLEEAEVEYPGQVNAAILSPTLKVDDVSFRYAEGERLVINHCSFEVKQGENVAIVGSSGCGKSTLLKLMLGIAEPESGVVRFGGVDLKQVGTQAYRNLFGVVLQDDDLLSGSIAENIGFFSGNIDMHHVEDCARIAAIHKDIQAMPLGYHTLVGDMGTSLSGGQKQRILLARALYKRPKLLFLDEATSHLDVSSEQMVNNAVRQLGITTVVIAHRPETIRKADRILFMEDGNVREIDIGFLETLTSLAVAKEGVVI